MKNLSLLVCLFVFFTGSLVAQTKNRDVVYLKNGSVVRGVIVEQTPGKQLKIEIIGDGVSVYPMDEVMKVGKEKLAKSAREDDALSSVLREGFITIVEGGYGFGVGEAPDLSNKIMLDVIPSWQFNSVFSCGLGVGIRRHVIENAFEEGTSEDMLFMPLYLQAKIHFDVALAPFIALGMGYAPLITELKKTATGPSTTQGCVLQEPHTFTAGFRGGLMIKPQLGVSFRVSPGIIASVSGVFESQALTAYIKNESSGEKLEHTIYLKALGIIAGVTF